MNATELLLLSSSLLFKLFSELGEGGGKAGHFGAQGGNFNFQGENPRFLSLDMASGRFRRRFVAWGFFQTRHAAEEMGKAVFFAPGLAGELDQ